MRRFIFPIALLAASTAFPRQLTPVEGYARCLEEMKESRQNAPAKTNPKDLKFRPFADTAGVTRMYIFNAGADLRIYFCLMPGIYIAGMGSNIFKFKF
ncbi:MAG: hypothetical protein K2H76_00840 [Muribaculaceae bacterium]|nr:hypothetical protein [Muribaculaceae bacterium]